MRVIDKAGKIYRSEAWYPMVDPISGHTYQPGEFVRVDENTWIKGQATMKLQKEVSEKPSGKGNS